MDFKYIREEIKDFEGMQEQGALSDYNLERLEELRLALSICDVVSSCVDKDTLIEDLNDKRIVGKTIDENMWHYCRKETAQHLLDKYEIKPK